MGYENVGRVWTPDSLKSYLDTITIPAWCKGITLHHTATPSLAQRPNGFIAQHLKNLQSFYQGKGWSAGPHLFVDDDQLWGMCDFRRKGVHAVGFNSSMIGIEVLGDYSTHSGNESAKTGRGLDCWKTAAAGTKVLLAWLDLPANNNTVTFHREDGVTDKDCPGDKIDKTWILGLIGGASVAPVPTTYPKPAIDVTLKASEWRFEGEKWCVPVSVYLTKKGKTMADVTKNLKKVGKDFFYGTELLEGAFYDVSSAWAPVRELTELP